MTEELWHALPHDGDWLATAAWPDPTEGRADPPAELEMDVILEAVRLLRNLRADEHVPADALPPAWIRPAGGEVASLLERERGTVERLSRVRPLELLAADAPAPPRSGSRVAPFGECYLERPAAAPEESEALGREREKLEALLEKTRGRLADPGFRSRAPPEVVREAEEKARELAARIRRIDEHMNPEGSVGRSP